MKRRGRIGMLWIGALVCLTLLVVAFAACETLLPQTENVDPEYSEWISAGDGTHVRTLLSDPTVEERESCLYVSEVIAPTCSAAGYTLHRCVKCEASYRTDETAVDPEAHLYVRHAGQSATCTADGWEEYFTCAYCDYTNYRVLERTGHDLGEWTYLSDAEHARACRRCEYVEQEAHLSVADAAVAATCTEGGLTAGTHCVSCRATLLPQRETLPLDHSLVLREGKAQTCLEEGWAAYYECTRCDYTEKETLAALGHAFGAELSYDGASHFYACARCEAKSGIAAHREVADPAVERTCLTDGLTEGAHCADCGYVIKAQEVVANYGGHDEIPHDAVAPRCESVGWSAYHTCSRCDYSDYVEIPALGHDPIDHEAEAPTCTAVGCDAYVTCLRCDYTTYVAIPALGHDILSEKASSPTCVTVGYEAYEYCARCDYTTRVDIPALGHAIESYEHDADEHWATCTRCLSEVERATHAFDPIPVIPPTCTEEGTAEYRCSVCAYSYVDVAAAMGHDYAPNEIPATCVSYAKTTYRCSRCADSYTEVTGDGYGAHDYEANTCRYCQRDVLLDYLGDFTAHGDSPEDAIALATVEEIALLFDYLVVYRVTTDKYFTYPDATINNGMAIINEAREKVTAQNWSPWASMSLDTEQNVRYFYAHCNVDGPFAFADVCTVTPTSGDYEATTLTQQEFVRIDRRGAARADDYGDFPYLTRTYTLAVTSSDELFYAFSHGYKPLPTLGSAAEEMLEAAKAVCREIISDDMSDRDKLYAIMQWMVSEVSYDYGAYADTSLVWQHCTSWYMEGVFRYGIAVCDGISKAVCVLAGIEDIKCVRLVGDNHAWNRVWVDAGDGEKRWYVFDATHANLGFDEVGYEIYSLQHFLISDDMKAAYGCTARNYTAENCAAITPTNPYALVHYGTAEPSSANDLVISNYSELTDAMAALVTVKQGASTESVSAEIFIERSYCFTETMATNAIRNALTGSGYSQFRFVAAMINYAGRIGILVIVIL